MIGRSEVFGYGEMFRREIERLIRCRLLDPAEAASLVAQITSHCDLAGELICQQNGPKELSPLLQKLCNSDEIEAMLSTRIDAHVIGQERKDRYKTYHRIVSDARTEFLADSEYMTNQCATAREWPMYAKEEMRRIRAHWLFLGLYLVGVKFRWGFRSDAKELTARLRSLTVGLPHHGSCMA